MWFLKCEKSQVTEIHVSVKLSDINMNEISSKILNDIILFMV